MITSLAEARRIAGSLGEPSKMPGMAYGLPARACKVGSKLRPVKGTTCHECYAFKGRYRFASTLNSQTRRLKSIDDPQWVDAMVYMIDNAPKDRRGYFRWHDSGDLQSIDHLDRIVQVAQRLPDVKFWLPTREQRMVKSYLEHFGDFPPNLIVRVSAALVDGKPPSGFKLTSGVHVHQPYGHVCEAKKHGNQCGKCRACWDPEVTHVSYPKH